MSDHRDIVDYCLVCGLPLQVTKKFLEHELCPSCGCHFGLDDLDLESAREARQGWLDSGPKWWRDGWGQVPPENWDPQEQMKNIPSEWL
jgi:hypothetical protein